MSIAVESAKISLMRIIDAHVHIYPDVIADKAIEGISKFYDGMIMQNSGKVCDLVETMRQSGIDKAVVCSVATSKKQVSRINDFMALQLQRKELHPLATLHPDMDRYEIIDEVARIKAMGLKGIKLHPDCQCFKLNGERGLRLFDAISDFDLPVLVHTGDKRFDYSHPKYMVEIARDYPDIRFIAAHFGGWSEWEDALRYKGLKNVWFDTSSTLYQLDGQIAKSVLFSLGIERFMFGTDYPMWNCSEEIERIYELDLGEKNNELVFHKNAERLFAIDPCE